MPYDFTFGHLTHSHPLLCHNFVLHCSAQLDGKLVFFVALKCTDLKIGWNGMQSFTRFNLKSKMNVMKEYKKLCVCEICKKSGQHSLHFAVTEGSASCEKKIKLRSGKSKPKFCEGENG